MPVILLTQIFIGRPRPHSQLSHSHHDLYLPFPAGRVDAGEEGEREIITQTKCSKVQLGLGVLPLTE